MLSSIRDFISNSLCPVNQRCGPKPCSRQTRLLICEKPKLVPNCTNAKVASLDTYIILKETSSATVSVFTISRTAKAKDLNISPLI